MKVFTWSHRNNYLAEQQQALCFWAREWRRMGYDPHVVRPEHRDLPDLGPIMAASQMQDLSVWARWAAPNVAPTPKEPLLIVEPFILPICSVEKLKFSKLNPFRRLDACTRVIVATKSTSVMLERFLKADWTVFKGKPFTDWDMLTELLPLSPTNDATYDFGATEPESGAWFVARNEWDLLKLREEAYAR